MNNLQKRKVRVKIKLRFARTEQLRQELRKFGIQECKVAIDFWDPGTQFRRVLAHFTHWLHRFDICRSESEGQWSLLLWLVSVTTMAACHPSGIYPVYISARLSHRSRRAGLLAIIISQGSVATRENCGGICAELFIINNKNRSVFVWQRDERELGVLFFLFTHGLHWSNEPGKLWWLTSVLIVVVIVVVVVVVFHITCRCGVIFFYWPNSTVKESHYFIFVRNVLRSTC